MKQEITLKSAKEILAFFEANPGLSFNQVNEIVHAYAGGQFTAVIFKPKGNTAPRNDERPKRELLEWLERNGEALDNGEVAHFFTSKFPVRNNN